MNQQLPLPNQFYYLSGGKRKRKSLEVIPPHSLIDTAGQFVCHMCGVQPLPSFPSCNQLKFHMLGHHANHVMFSAYYAAYLQLSFRNVAVVNRCITKKDLVFSPSIVTKECLTQTDSNETRECLTQTDSNETRECLIQTDVTEPCRKKRKLEDDEPVQVKKVRLTEAQKFQKVLGTILCLFGSEEERISFLNKKGIAFQLPFKVYPERNPLMKILLKVQKEYVKTINMGIYCTDNNDVKMPYGSDKKYEAMSARVIFLFSVLKFVNVTNFMLKRKWANDRIPAANEDLIKTIYTLTSEEQQLFDMNLEKIVHSTVSGTVTEEQPFKGGEFPLNIFIKKDITSFEDCASEFRKFLPKTGYVVLETKKKPCISKDDFCENIGSMNSETEERSAIMTATDQPGHFGLRKKHPSILVIMHVFKYLLSINCTILYDFGMKEMGKKPPFNISKDFRMVPHGYLKKTAKLFFNYYVSFLKWLLSIFFDLRRLTEVERSSRNIIPPPPPPSSGALFGMNMPEPPLREILTAGEMDRVLYMCDLEIPRGFVSFLKHVRRDCHIFSKLKRSHNLFYERLLPFSCDIFYHVMSPCLLMKRGQKMDNFDLHLCCLKKSVIPCLEHHHPKYAMGVALMVYDYLYVWSDVVKMIYRDNFTFVTEWGTRNPYDEVYERFNRETKKGSSTNPVGYSIKISRIFMILKFFRIYCKLHVVTPLRTPKLKKRTPLLGIDELWKVSENFIIPEQIEGYASYEGSHGDPNDDWVKNMKRKMANFCKNMKKNV